VPEYHFHDKREEDPACPFVVFFQKKFFQEAKFLFSLVPFAVAHIATTIDNRYALITAVYGWASEKGEKSTENARCCSFAWLSIR
jgi:hypothetical protein